MGLAADCQWSTPRAARKSSSARNFGRAANHAEYPDSAAVDAARNYGYG